MRTLAPGIVYSTSGADVGWTVGNPKEKTMDELVTYCEGLVEKLDKYGIQPADRIVYVPWGVYFGLIDHKKSLGLRSEDMKICGILVKGGGNN